MGSLLGEWFERLRPASGFGVPLSWRELDEMNGVFHPERFDLALMQERTEAGFVGMGRALAGWLLKACVDSGVDIHLETRARALLTEGRRVTGVEAADHRWDHSYVSSRPEGRFWPRVASSGTRISSPNSSPDR